MPTLSRLAARAACLALMLACDRARPVPDSANLATSPGAADSIASGSAIAPPEQWKLVEEWRVGGEARGAQSFDYTFGLAVLPDGNLLHLDAQASQLHVLDTLGRTVRTFGSKGGGPGEILSATGFVVAPDGRIIVNDLNASRFVVFTPAGEHERSVRVSAPRGTGGRWRGVMLDDGQLVETITPHANERTRRDEGPVTMMWASDLSRVDTLRRESCTSGRGAGRAGETIVLLKPDASVATEMTIPFTTPETPVAYDPSGARWEARDPSSNEIVRRPLEGCAATRAIRLHGSRAPWSDAQRGQIAARVIAEARRWQAVPPVVDDLPREQPWFRSIQVDDQGRVWVERVLSSGDLATDVFAPDGAPLARIEGDLPQSPVFAGPRVYGLVRDEDDVSYLVALRITPVRVAPVP